MVELDIEIWPTSIVVPAGYRIGLSIRGKDYVYPGPSGGKLSNFKNELTGCGPFLHDDPRDRPPEIFGGVTSLHFGAGKAPCLLLPIIPPQRPVRAAANSRRGRPCALGSTMQTQGRLPAKFAKIGMRKRSKTTSAHCRARPGSPSPSHPPPRAGNGCGSSPA